MGRMIHANVRRWNQECKNRALRLLHMRLDITLIRAIFTGPKFE